MYYKLLKNEPFKFVTHVYGDTERRSMYQIGQFLVWIKTGVLKLSILCSSLERRHYTGPPRIMPSGCVAVLFSAVSVKSHTSVPKYSLDIRQNLMKPAISAENGALNK